MKQEMEEELVSNILPFWINRMTDEVNGGFYGRITGREEVKPEAEKGAILNARILWTFSAAYRLLKRPEYLETATRAKRTLIDRFYDNEFGGVYWSLDYKGNPLDTKKQIYALGFAIYGLSEYARATGDDEALAYAIRLFETIEEHSFDPVKNGYCEALTREWGEIADMRLSAKDENERKTMNTHLHIIEPYTNLYRVWKTPELEKSIRNLLDIFTDKLLNKETYHLDLFFNDEWEGKRNIESYGHDIEASWLLHETALVLDDKILLHKIERIIRRIADAADEGLRPDGSMVYEHWKDGDKYDLQRQWWVQCENIIGHIDLYQYFRTEENLLVAISCWNYVAKHLLDAKNGEWHWAILEDGTVNKEDDKAGFWKCPYHNSRMCLELIERDY